MIKYTNCTEPHAGLPLSQLWFFSRGKLVVNVLIKLISTVDLTSDFGMGEQLHPVVSVVMS